MSHPPYSPDLSPNDSCLFPHVKNNMRGQRFSTPEEAIVTFRMHVLEILQSEWQSASAIGSNACKSVQILMGNILKNNKAIFDD